MHSALLPAHFSAARTKNRRFLCERQRNTLHYLLVAPKIALTSRCVDFARRWWISGTNTLLLDTTSTQKHLTHRNSRVSLRSCLYLVLSTDAIFGGFSLPIPIICGHSSGIIDRAMARWTQNKFRVRVSTSLRLDRYASSLYARVTS